MYNTRFLEYVRPFFHNVHERLKSTGRIKITEFHKNVSAALYSWLPIKLLKIPRKTNNEDLATDREKLKIKSKIRSKNIVPSRQILHYSSKQTSAVVLVVFFNFEQIAYNALEFLLFWKSICWIGGNVIKSSFIPSKPFGGIAKRVL